MVMDPFRISEYVSVSITVVFLLIAAISDFRTREVPDKVWLAFAPLGLTLTIFRTFVNPSVWFFTAVSIGLSILIAFGLVVFGLAGGADAKALMCLGLTLPLPPGVANPLLGFVHPFYPIVVLVTAYVCSISVAFWMLGKNMISMVRLKSEIFKGLDREPALKKGLAFITGFPTSVANLKSTFYLYPMEKVVENGSVAHRTLQMYSNVDIDREQVVSEYTESLRKVNPPNLVWVTPGLPLLVFMLIAVVITLVVGDPVFAGIFLMLHH